MSKKVTYQIRYKYPGEAWTEYDRTQVTSWAELQLERCKAEHPTAEIEMKVKE